jgi:hypothetical protein
MNSPHVCGWVEVALSASCREDLGQGVGHVEVVASGDLGDMKADVAAHFSKRLVELTSRAGSTPDIMEAPAGSVLYVAEELPTRRPHRAQRTAQVLADTAAGELVGEEPANLKQRLNAMARDFCLLGLIANTAILQEDEDALGYSHV